MLEHGRKGFHFGEARSPLRLLLCKVFQTIHGPIVLIRNVSIFSFSVGFCKNRRFLEFVLGAGNRVMGSIYWKLGEKAVILEQRAARSLYYYAKFYRRYTGLWCSSETYRFSLFLWVFLKTKGLWSLFRALGIRLWAKYIIKWAERPASCALSLHFFCGFLTLFALYLHLTALSLQ